MPAVKPSEGREINQELFSTAVPYKVCRLGDAEICFFSSTNLCAFSDTWANITHFHYCYEFHYVKSGFAEIEDQQTGTLFIAEDMLCAVPPQASRPIPRSANGIERTTLAIRLEKLEKKVAGMFSEYAYYTEILERIQTVRVLNAASLLPLIRKIGVLSRKSSYSAEHMLAAYLSVFFIELCSLLNQDTHESISASLPREDRSLHKIHRRWIIENYITNSYTNENPIEELMLQMHLSKRQTDRVVYQLMGESLAQLIAKQRMLETKKYLQTTSMTLEEISERVGYRSYSGFYNAVRKYCDTTPEKLSRELRKGRDKG